MNKSTERFSNRVQDYVKYRPGYPAEVLQLFKTQYNLSSEHTVVDVGAGTGISAEIFLKNGNPVIAIEPNDKMREQMNLLLADYPKLISMKATSEETGLADNCADLVIAAQAFHWFDPVKTRAEFSRILNPRGIVAILFNDRKRSGSPFLERYEALLNEFGTDYKKVAHTNISDERIQNFLGEHKKFVFQNHQDFDFNGLLGRLSSSSYVPPKSDPLFEPMQKALIKIFEETADEGRVRMQYETILYCSNPGS